MALATADEIIVKDSHVSRNYTVDWSTVLGDDTITASTWDVPAGLTLGPDTYEDTTTTARISGGTVGQVYLVTNTVTTAGGQTLVWHIEFRISELIIDWSTDLGKVRAITGDTNPSQFFMSDAELSALLEVGGSVMRASVMALRAMAAKHINILKDAVTLDIETRASNMARELNRLAEKIETRLEEAGEDQSIDFIEMVDDDFALREKVYKHWGIW